MSTCHYCGPTDRELRPYGPGGSNICFPCMKADPDRERTAGQVFGALLDANAAIGDGVVVIGSQDGPQPFDVEDLPATADPVRDAIAEWAAPNDELGWVGSPEVAQHAQEIADFLWERGLSTEHARPMDGPR